MPNESTNILDACNDGVVGMDGVDNVHKVDIENRVVTRHRIRLLVSRPGVRFCVDRKEMGKEMENIHNHYDRSCIKDLVT